MGNLSTNGAITGGTLNVVVTSNGGHSADTLADLCVEKLMYVSKDAPEPIRLQAQAYKDTIRKVVLGYIVQAKASERTTTVMKLKQHGMENAAQIIGAL